MYIENALAALKKLCCAKIANSDGMRFINVQQKI